MLQVTIALLKNAMIKSSSDLFLVDGFPRALDQAETFERDILPCQMVSSFDGPLCCQVPAYCTCSWVAAVAHEQSCMTIF